VLIQGMKPKLQLLLNNCKINKCEKNENIFLCEMSGENKLGVKNYMYK